VTGKSLQAFVIQRPAYQGDGRSGDGYHSGNAGGSQKPILPYNVLQQVH